MSAEIKSRLDKTSFQNAFKKLEDRDIVFMNLNAEVEAFKAGTVIFEQNQDPEKILVVLKGHIRVVRKAKTGDWIDLTDPLGPGDTLGEMSFVDTNGASATIIADDDVWVQVVDRDLIEKMMDLDPNFAERFYHSLVLTMIRRIRQMDEKLAFPV